MATKTLHKVGRTQWVNTGGVRDLGSVAQEY
jgi:hypothetical protein